MYRRNRRGGGPKWFRTGDRNRQESDYKNNGRGGPSYERHSNRSEDRPRGRGRGHPPGLRGKEIGLYYRDLHKRKRLEEKILVRQRIKLNPSCREKIMRLLHTAERKWGCPDKRPYLLNAVKIEEEESQNSEGIVHTAERKGESRDEKPNLSIAIKTEEDEEKEEKPQNAECGSVSKGLEHKYKHIRDSRFKQQFIRSVTGNMESNLEHSLSVRVPISKRRDSDLDKMLKQQLEQRQMAGGPLLSFRRTLPAYKMQKEILEIIAANQVVLLSGETGCGKTTQVAQFILDAEIAAERGSICRIVNTQPRRISAISVAQRVAEERDEPCGGQDSSCGYQIRLEKALPRHTGSILYCTTGILLQWMQSDPALPDISHIVLDEIHERDIISDFVMTILKDVLPRRPDLKLVLMSATLNAESFSRYFDNCPLINIPGFTYPVQELYLEDVLQITEFTMPICNDSERRYFRCIATARKRHKREEYENWIAPYIRKLETEGKYSTRVIHSLRNPDCEELNIELIRALVQYICMNKPEGAILVFLPGWDNISALNRSLEESGAFPPYKYRIIPLHSLMPTVMQKSVFERPPPGVRKIIISTSIAETSITIDDVVYVVDCGKTKMKNFDIEKNISTLQPEWVSLANAKQRRGRAGRVQPGVCYHLYTRAREMMLQAYPLPEMLRSRLEEVILQVKILQLGRAAEVLTRVMDPPDSRAVDLSLELLHTLGALDQDETLTPLGFHLARLPLDPQTGKMILMAAIFGCIDPIFSIAASLSFKDAFVIPLGKESQVDAVKRELAAGSCSDHIVLAEAVRRWEASGSGRSGFCHRYFLSWNTLTLLKNMKKQFAEHLYEMNFLATADPKDGRANIHSNNRSLIKAIVCAGLYPNVAIVRKVRKVRKTMKYSVTLDTPEDGRVKLHPKSVNEQCPEFPSPLLVYHQKLRSTAVYLHDTTMVSPLAVLFFGCGIVYEGEDSGDGVVVLPGDLRFACYRETADVIQILQKLALPLWPVLVNTRKRRSRSRRRNNRLRDSLDQLLAHKVSHPGPIDWSPRSDEAPLLRAIMDVLSYEDIELRTVAEEVDSCGEDDDF
ncbi:ATP-dependent DNA/RNA helicase DHX36-like isoform X1 [Schistocerca piceifrons]|uniref:ATP-dependent DNA/RNA helicase DHX36-like isoform X1 n=2 Tax=Schistocerca piceifrons TaxID=274613 RepID=UPI001F5FB475|nr:ATP-dependent DNA/RNA helicase DHX36-like isoform X1 [Schistocerca piceifrons]